jgi:hypothetical protein
MDLSREQRAQAAAQLDQQRATLRDQRLIANVLRSIPEDCLDQWLALGAVCPYWPNQRRERAAWIEQINRQREELSKCQCNKSR